MDRVTEGFVADRRDEGDGHALTAPEAMQLDYIAPPEDLQPFVTTFFLFRCDECTIRDIQPAATSQLQFYLRGRGRMHYPHGRTDDSHAVTLQGVTLAAAPFEVDGPFHAFGAALSALGWAALTGIPADQGADSLIDAATVLGSEVEELGADVRAAYDTHPEMDGTALRDMVAGFIRQRLRPVPAGHLALLRQVTGWLGTGLNPEVQELYDSSEYSPRQVQRLVVRYFGSRPTHLARVYRATRVVALLSEPGVTAERVAELTNAFYDQSHMIREIREFVGRTPQQLFAESSTILRTLVDVKNFREIKPNVAPLPPLESEGPDA